MKKIISIIFVAILFLLIYSPLTLSAESQHFVLDHAEVLSEQEELTLTNIAEEYAIKGITVIFATANTTDNAPDEEYCKMLEQKYMSTIDGVIIFINLGNESVYVHRVGKCIASFPNKKLSEIIDKTYHYPSQQKYFDFFANFENMSKKYILNAENDLSSTPFIPTTQTTIIALFIMFLTGLCLILSHTKNNLAPLGQKYLNKSFTINNRSEKFIGDRQKVVKNYYRVGTKPNRRRGI